MKMKISLFSLHDLRAERVRSVSFILIGDIDKSVHSVFVNQWLSSANVTWMSCVHALIIGDS